MNKIGDILAYRVELLSSINKRNKQQERMLEQYMNVARLFLLAQS